MRGFSYASQVRLAMNLGDFLGRFISVFFSQSAKPLKTNFYVDGFNLYYRAVKDTPYKWLNLLDVCQYLTPTHLVNRIRYFTAAIQPRTGDLQGPQRQQTYIRALRTIPNLVVHYGLFRPRKIRRPLVSSMQGVFQYVEVMDTEEKATVLKVKRNEQRMWKSCRARASDA